MKIYRAGIIGTGFIGAVHIETLRRLGNVEVAALTDTCNAKETAEKLNVPSYFSDYKKMIDSVELDTVHICTPNNTHYEIAMYAMDHGISVICEKPMCTTIKEAEALVAKAAEKGLVNGINFHNRFYPMNNHLKNIIRDGELGDIFSITGNYTQDWLLFDTDYSWRLSAKESGNTRAVSDIGSHWMDLAEYVTGQKIVAVNADFSTIHAKRKKPRKTVLAFSKETFQEEDYEPVDIDTEDNANILFKFSGGAIGSAFFSQVIAGKSVDINLQIGGYKKSAEWHSMNCNALTIGNRDSFNETIEKGIATVHPETRPLIAYPFGHAEGFPDAFKQSFRSIYDHIADPTGSYEHADFEDGLHEMILCQKIFESNQRQGWVNIDGE